MCVFCSEIRPQANSTYGLAKAEHKRLFDNLVAPLPGFQLVGDDKYMYPFHAKATGGEIAAFANVDWQALVDDFLTYLPEGVCLHAPLPS